MSGQDYIGSKISLISLSDIRYVGILHSINTNDSTVSLENVRSFGTEGRRGNPDDEVVPSDTVFDFVVFRGSDIKDLQVFEAPVKPVAPPPPPPSSRPQGMMDPSHRQSMEGYPPPPPMNPYMMPSYPPQTHQAMYWQSPMYSGQQQQQQQQPMGQSPMGQSPMQPAPVPQPKQQQPATTLQPATIPQAPVPTRDMATREQPLTSTKQLDQQEIDGATVENLAKQVSELDVDSKDANKPSLAPSSPPLSSPTQPQPQQQQQQRQSNYRNVRQNNNNYRQNNNNNYGNASRGQTGKQRINIPQSDFDFESSNAKFSKNDLLKELFDGDTDERKDEQHNIPRQQQYAQEEEEVVIPPANDDGFYNKSKSFFDNISCESKERQDQEGLSIDRRGKYQEERKLNFETFGQASVDQSRYRNFRGRGGYRGGYRGNRGGGGGYYRGGNRNNNNNRGNYSGHRPQPQQQAEL